MINIYIIYIILIINNINPPLLQLLLSCISSIRRKVTNKAKDGYSTLLISEGRKSKYIICSYEILKCPRREYIVGSI